jgi:hypothetical protein
MSMLPTGRSLRNFLPDLDDLLERPAEYLGVGPVVFGPRRMYGLALLFALPGVAFILAYVFGKHDAERIALGIGMLMGSAVWLGWSLWARGHALVLQRDGVEVKHHDLTVWCPWALFNAPGEPHVPDVDSPFTGLIQPVAADAVPFIELRRAESVIAHGGQVRAPQFVLAGDDRVVLPGRYEVAARDLGDLLLHLGRVLGAGLPRGAPPREAYQVEREDVPEPDPSGWITVRPTRLQFPPTCCSCGTETSDVLRLESWTRGSLLMRIFVPSAGHEVTVAVPVCEACQTELRARQTRGAVRGLLVGSLFGPLVLLLGGWVGGWGNALSGLAAIGVGAAGALIGFGIGNTFTFRPPVRVGSYSPTQGTVRIRFENPEYAAAFLDRMRRSATR